MPQHKATVFVVGDDQSVCGRLRGLVQSVDLKCESFRSVQALSQMYEPGQPGCLILDIPAPAIGGMELVEELRSRHINLPFIILTGDGDIPTAVRAMKAGAMDFVEKPVSPRYLLSRIRDALKQDTWGAVPRVQRAAASP